VGSSPRGSLDLMALSRANAALNGRDYVIPQDVKKLASTTLAHRLILEVSSWLSGTSAELIIKKILENVRAPRRE
jgi:MoxR-like ATPase